MESDPKEQVILRQYLLGELSDESRQHVEERLLTDGDSLEELAITEEELIDQYLNDDLTAPEREHFEAFFLATPERHKKLAFARAFKKYVAVAADAKASDTLVSDTKASDTAYPSYTPPPKRGFFPAFFGARNPILSFSLAAALLLLVGLGAWRLISNLRPSEEHTFAVILTSGATRAGGQMQRLTIPAGTGAVNLQLETTQGDYTDYRATLLTDEAREVLTQTGLKAQTANNGRLVNFIVPAKKLSSGDYQVKLSGQSAAKGFEELDSYAFRVTQ